MGNDARIACLARKSGWGSSITYRVRVSQKLYSVPARFFDEGKFFLYVCGGKEFFCFLSSFTLFFFLIDVKY